MSDGDVISVAALSIVARCVTPERTPPDAITSLNTRRDVRSLRTSDRPNVLLFQENPIRPVNRFDNTDIRRAEYPHPPIHSRWNLSVSVLAMKS